LMTHGGALVHPSFAPRTEEKKSHKG